MAERRTGFEHVPGPQPDDGRWCFVFAQCGVLAIHPEHPLRFMEYANPGLWKIVNIVPDEDGK